ncbi:MAG TPA: transcriptional repressor [bacterium]|nr:transcriptional repressor [bacterium]HOL34914.1 transcriptional repressor [bacterium]HPP08234.1 transcriptional repressor [bacterium]
MRTDKWIIDIENLAKNAGSFKIKDLIALAKNSGMNVSRATVYRVINKLCKAGKIVPVSNRKEQYFEFIGEKIHYHFRCKKCKKTMEFFSDKIENSIRETTNKLGILMTEHTLIIEGLCRKCRKIRK